MAPPMTAGSLYNFDPLPNESSTAYHTRIRLIHDVLQHQVVLTRELTNRQQMCIERHEHELVHLKDLHQMALAQQMQREGELEKVKEVMSRNTNGLVGIRKGEETRKDARGGMGCEGCVRGKEGYGHSEVGRYVGEKGGEDGLEVMDVMVPLMVLQMRDIGMETEERDEDVMVDVQQEEPKKQEEQGEEKQDEKAGMEPEDNDSIVTLNSPEQQQQQKQNQPEEAAPEDEVIFTLGHPQHQKLEPLVETNPEDDHGIITLDSPKQLRKEPPGVLVSEDYGTVTLDSPQQQEQQQQPEPDSVKEGPETESSVVPSHQETMSPSQPNEPINLEDSSSTGAVPSYATPSESSATFPLVSEDNGQTQTQSPQKKDEEPTPPMSPIHQPANISWKSSVLEECVICQEYHYHDHYIQHMCGPREDGRCVYIQELRISKKINNGIKGKAGVDNSNSSNGNDIVKDSNSVNDSSSNGRNLVNNNSSAGEITSKNSSISNSNNNFTVDSNNTNLTGSPSSSLLKAHSKAASIALGMSDLSLHPTPSLEKLSATFHKESDTVNGVLSRPFLATGSDEGKHSGGVKKMLCCRRWRK